MVKVKICGIRTVEDALMAVRLGADAVGVLVGQCYASSGVKNTEGFKGPVKVSHFIQRAKSAM